MGYPTMPDYLTYDNIGDQIADLVDDDDPSVRILIDFVVNNVYRDLIAEVSRAATTIPKWLTDFDDSLQMVGPATITGVTQANPGVVTATAHGMVSGDLVTIYDVAGMTELNYRTFRITRVNADSFQLKDFEDANYSTAALTAYTSGGTALHRGTTLATTGKAVERILRLAIPEQNSTLLPITETELDEDGTLWDSNTGRPDFYVHRKIYGATGTETNQLLWFYASDQTYRFRYWFEKRVSPLSAAADVPILPPWSHPALVYGSLEQLAMFDIRVKTGPWSTLYDAIKQDLISYTGSFVTDGDTKPWGL